MLALAVRTPQSESHNYFFRQFSLWFLFAIISIKKCFFCLIGIPICSASKCKISAIPSIFNLNGCVHDERTRKNRNKLKKYVNKQIRFCSRWIERNWKYSMHSSDVHSIKNERTRHVPVHIIWSMCMWMTSCFKQCFRKVRCAYIYIVFFSLRFTVFHYKTCFTALLLLFPRLIHHRPRVRALQKHSIVFRIHWIKLLVYIKGWLKHTYF